MLSQNRFVSIQATCVISRQAACVISRETDCVVSRHDRLCYIETDIDSSYCVETNTDSSCCVEIDIDSLYCKDRALCMGNRKTQDTHSYLQQNK